MSWFSEFFHPGNAYKNAANTSQQYYNQAQQGLQPYNQNGQQAGGDLMSMLQQLMNPEELQNKWASGYEESPYAKQLQNQAQSSGLDAASQMGLMGSNAALSNIEGQGANIMQGDRQNYMNDLMTKLQAGMGLGENIYGQGASAAGQMGQNAMTQGSNMANLKFNQENAGPAMLGKMGSGALQMLMQYLTAGMG